MNKEVKHLAIEYRKAGDSYSVICKKLKLSKSTLSNWVKDIPFIPNRDTLQRIKNGSRKSAEMRHAKKLLQTKDIRELAIGEIGKLSKRDLWLFGVGLYLGEGAKSIESVRIINSDPKVIKIAIVWFREIIGLDETNLSLSLHAYPDNNIESDIDYWAKLSGIPKSQFGKTQIDTRTGKRSAHKLPHGTVQLRVVANGEKKFGVSLHRRIMGWIGAVSDQVTFLV